MQIHEDYRSRHDHVGPSDRSFGVVAAVVCACIGAWPLVHHQPLRVWSLAAGAAFLGIALISAPLLHPLNAAWTRLGLLMNQVMSPIMTGILFFGVVTPIAYVFRLRGRDALRVRPDPAAPTYWLERRPPGPAPQSMKNQF